MDVELVREWLDHVAMDLDAAWSRARKARFAKPSRLPHPAGLGEAREGGAGG